MNGRKILIDTDIGDAIDDSIALCTAMAQGFEIIGITTVFQNTAQRSRMARKLLKAYGQGYEAVPVYAGHSEPIRRPAVPYNAIPLYTPDLETPAYAPDSEDPDAAVDFIINACHTYGDDLTIIAIGPFTNLARVIEKDADALNQAGRVVIMGGAYLMQYADWNVICDVIAAQALFRSCHHLHCIGADVTHGLPARGALQEALLNPAQPSPVRRCLQEMCQSWCSLHPGEEIFLHDPLAICYAANPSLCTMMQASVVVLTDGYAKGMTLNIDAYQKQQMNPEAYQSLDTSRKVQFAAAVDKQTFYSSLKL